MGWGNNDGSADVDGGAVGGTAGNASGPASSDDSADANMGGPSIGGASPAGDLSGGLGDIEASIAAEDMGHGFNFDAPPGGWGGKTAPSVNTQGQVMGSQHAGTAADSFAQAIDALDAAIGAMPSLGTPAPGAPSTGLSGMGLNSTVGYNENFDPMGSSHMGQFGQGTGIAAPGQTFGPGAAAPSGVMSALGTPNLGWGDDPFGDTMAPTNTVDPGLQAAVATGQEPAADVGWAGAGTPTNVGNPMGLGMDTSSVLGPGTKGTGAPGGPNQSGQTGVGAIGGPLGHGLEPGGMAPATTDAAALSAAEKGEDDMDALSSTSNIVDPGLQQALDALAANKSPLQGKFDPRDPTYYDKETIDKEEKERSTETKRGHLHTSATALRSALSIFGPFGAFLGTVPTKDEIDAMTPKEVDDMVAAINAKQAAQQATEEGLSTGEDDRARRAKLKAVSDFRKQYKWAANMSAKEIQAYIDNPALLDLKVGNEQMKSMDPTKMKLSDIRQLWSPAMSA
jgi:hypothetical protein